MSVRATRMFARRAETTNLALTSIHDFLITIIDINKAIKYLDSLDLEESFYYIKVTKEFSINVFYYQDN